MLIPLLAQLESAAPQPETVAGGGGGFRRKRKPVIPWRDPLYETADLQRELTEDEGPSDEVAAAEVVEAAIQLVGGGLQTVRGGLAKVSDLPPPPEPVVRAVLNMPVVTDWRSVIDAIKEAHRRERDRRRRREIMLYRAQVEAIRRRIERAREDEDDAEYLMAEGWL
jgi:hypothetical protein